MKFKIYTLIDITETQERSSSNKKQYCQQQNFLTILQTVGLRVNPYYEHSPQISDKPLNRLGFGSKFQGEQRVWTFEFEIEHQSALCVDNLKNDFKLIPFITSLDETVTFDTPSFCTQNKRSCNIIFKRLNK